MWPRQTSPIIIRQCALRYPKSRQIKHLRDVRFGRNIRMSDEQIFLLTSTAFRIAVIAAGFSTAYLGYRLLLRGVGSDQPQSTDAVAKIGHFKVSFTRLAPGSIFALFGMALLGWMVHDGSPQFKSSASPSGTSLVMRGGQASELIQFDKANRLLEAGNKLEALRAYQEFTDSFAVSANNMATLLIDSSRFDEAITLSRLSVALSPENHEFLDTLVTVLARSGDKEEARRVLKRAINLAPESERPAIKAIEGEITRTPD